jgi:hypothetical protein
MPNLRWNCDGPKGCYLHQLPDWASFNDCFPRGIRISDVDGIVEIGRRFLMLEWKGSKNVPLPNGQRMLLQRFGRPPDAVLCLRGTPDDLQWLIFDGSEPGGWRDVSLDEVKAWVKRWAADADRNPWPAAPSQFSSLTDD